MKALIMLVIFVVGLLAISAISAVILAGRIKDEEDN
jgi:hypothetical protein